MVPLLVGAVLALAFVFAGSALAWTTNLVQLDNGTCGRNLQIGSDTTASASNTPSFWLMGDGGLSSYAAFVDGVSIGTFNSDGSGNVCIVDATPLATGSHVLTANELAPRPSMTVAPFNFSVDTVPPPPPSTPVISSYSDSGVLGDGITMYRAVNFTGSSDPSMTIQLLNNGVTVTGGAKANLVGAWSATTSTLADGTYHLSAIAIDGAGNKSALSSAITLTIDGTAPAVTVSSPSSGSTVSGSTTVAGTASDTIGVSKVDFQVDGVTKATDTSSPYSYSWDTTTVGNGSHTVSEIATDVAGNSSTASVTVTVSNGAATVPGAPTLNSAIAGNASVALAWSAPASNGAPRSAATASTARPRAAERRCWPRSGSPPAGPTPAPSTAPPTTTRSAPSTRSAQARSPTNAPPLPRRARPFPARPR